MDILLSVGTAILGIIILSALYKIVSHPVNQANFEFYRHNKYKNAPDIWTSINSSNTPV